jgi:hypothetical protein
MTTFSNAVKSSNLNQKTTTTNGMKVRVSSGKEVVDFFFKAGAMRGKNIVPLFNKALSDDKELALRVAQWLRDARGGAGEREHYRNILKAMEVSNDPMLESMIAKTPLLGRWDDLLVFETKKYKDIAYATIANGLIDESTRQLVCKWMPRESSNIASMKAIAKELMTFLDLSPKQYRKMLASVKTTETLMCAQEWEKINFSHVPSNASNRYRKAFMKQQKERFEKYVQDLTSGDTSAKVNVSTLYPYEITKNISYSNTTIDKQFLNAQWSALPNYVGDADILPLIDVSGSMGCPVGQPSDMLGKGVKVTCMDVAISLGLYLANKNTGKFKDTYLTFESSPKLGTLSSTDLSDNYQQIKSANWGGSTDIEKAFKEILRVATSKKVAQSEMPKYLLILSDMQFNACTGWNTTSQKTAKRLFEDAGYVLPNIIYWNIHAYDNVPVKFDKCGTALVSGFSPSIVKAVLSANLDDVKAITPYDVMLEAIMNPKYDL